MATLQGLGPVNYYDSMVPDFRGEALQETQNRLGHAQLQGLNMQNQQAQRRDQQQQQNQSLGNAAIDLQIASMQGPEAVQAALQKHAGAIQTLGVTPDSGMQSYTQNPQQFYQLAGMVGLKSLGPEAYFSAQQNQAKLQQTGQIAQANLGYKYDALNQQGAYQQGQLEQGRQKLDQGAQALTLTAQKNRADIANKQWELSLKANDNSATAQQKRQESAQKMQEYVGAYESNVNNVSGMLETVNQVKGLGPAPAEGQPDARIKPDDFDRIFGFGGTVNSMMPGTPSADAWSKIEQMQGQARLMGVIGMKGTGPVSDSEGQAAARAFLALNQNMSPKAARAAVDNWQKVLQRQATYLNKQQPTIDMYRQKIGSINTDQGGASSVPRAGQIEGGYTFLGGDPSNANSWRKN